MTCREYVFDVQCALMARRLVKTKVPRIDVAATRKKLAMSQGDFAEMFGINQGTVEQWEQGRREPSGPARLLLAVLDENPGAVLAVVNRRHRRS
jgi:DNA-binding transcriptional regulator YiaG